MITKSCKDCSIEKPIDDFYPHKGAKDKHSHICKVCNSLRNRQWQRDNKEKCAIASRKYRENNPESFKKYNRENKYKINYGITLEEWERLFELQGRKCAICLKGSVHESKEMCVDHCHETGNIRAILCRKCNSALGLFGDSPEILKRATNYLEKYK